MKTIEAKMDDTTQLLIEGARPKLNSSGEIIDAATLLKVKELINALTTNMRTV